MDVKLTVKKNNPILLDVKNGGGSGFDYNQAVHKPQIEGVELVGNKTFSQLGMNTLSVTEIEKILYLD